MRLILCNAFSLQMVDERDLHRVQFESVKAPSTELLSTYESAIGHEDTARVLGVKFNRTNVKMDDNTLLIIAQLQGGRLPEGSTELPEGYKFTWVHAYLTYDDNDYEDAA